MAMRQHRRAFLKSVAAGSAIAASLASAATVPQHAAKRVLLALPKSPLADAVAATLTGVYDLRSGGDLLPGTEAIVLLPDPAGSAGLAQQIDHSTRGAYDLLQNGVTQGVGHVIYLSTLRMMAAYPSQFQVDEDFAPRPTDSAGLPEYLGEFVCREFAREGKLSVVVLRQPDGLDPRDAAQAVRLALDAQLAGSAPRLGTWSVFHLSGSAKAEKLLGYHARFGGPRP